jgi:hypothetical protein
MKLSIKAGIVTAASVALIGGAAFAAPSFAVDSVESEPTQSQEMRQLHKAERTGEKSADCDHSDEEKAAHQAEKKAQGEQLSDEEKAARKAEHQAGAKGEGKRMGQGKGKGPHSES